MAKIQDEKYIQDIGIKKVVCHTGMENIISILNNGKKYKQFAKEYQKLDEYGNQEFLDNLILQSKFYGHPIVSFPEIVIKDDKRLYGIVSDFEKGIPLVQLPLDMEIHYLIYLVDCIERGIKDISEDGWQFEDLHEENILINPNSESNPARIIDTDYYQLRKPTNKKEALENYRENLKKIFNAVTYSVIPELKISNIWENKKLRKSYMLASTGIITCTDFLRELLYYLKMYNISGKNIETLQNSL